LSAFRYVFLNGVQGGPKILCAISIAARVEQERRIDRGFVEDEVQAAKGEVMNGKSRKVGGTEVFPARVA
jgi:hypothetical protein